MNNIPVFGDVISDWSVSPIASLGSIVTGNTPDTKVTEYYDGTIPFVSPSDVGTTMVVRKTIKTITEKGLSKTRSIPEKSVMVVCIGSTIGKVAISENECATNQQINSIVPNAANDSAFVFYCMTYLSPFIKLMAGTQAVPIINKTEFGSLLTIKPPLPEQQKIASILTSVDEVIERTESQIAKLQDLKTGMMQELLTKGIGHTEFKDSPVGRIPVGWEVLPIKDICTHVVDCVNKTAPVVDYQTPFKMIRTTNVRNGRVDTDNVRFVTQETYNIWTRRLVPKSGDLIFTREAPVGESGILKNSDGVFLGQRTMMYRTDPSIANSTYLMYSLYSDYCKKQFEDFSGGSTVAHLRVPDCEKLLIKLPMIDEQNHIASVLSSIESKMEAQQKKRAGLQRTKKALMQDLLTGKVRVKGD